MDDTSQGDDVFRAISDPTRRAIIERLKAGPVNVNALATLFPQSRPAISKHLRILRQASLVAEEKIGRERHYRLQPDRLRSVAEWIDGYAGFWRESLGNLKQRLENEQ